MSERQEYVGAVRDPSLEGEEEDEREGTRNQGKD
ncbi:hypothetical protein M728_002022 [Ensifer sp. WSM1721]